MMNLRREIEKRDKQTASASFLEEEKEFLNQVAQLDADEAGCLMRIYSFVQQLNYSNQGSYVNYMNHILRMGNMCFSLYKGDIKEILMTVLAHNAIEAAGMTEEELSKVIGKSAAENVHTLTVDRGRQEDSAYMKGYYAKIAQCDVCACTKIIDKTDNLFMLQRNPNLAMRERYIREIEDYVVPMAEKQGLLPEGSSILRQILKSVYRMEITV